MKKTAAALITATIALAGIAATAPAADARDITWGKHQARDITWG